MKPAFSFLKDTFFLRIFIIILIFVCFGCAEKPLKVGYVGGLTGRHYDLGLSGRNGATMAVDRINRSGGIRGRKIRLVIKDDQQNPEKAKKAVNELIEDGVVAVIGHMTSSMTRVTLPIVNEKNIVMISPTTSSSYFEGKDDNLIMLYPSTRITARFFSEYISRTMRLHRIAVVYDLSNRAYSESWYENFKTEFEKPKGNVVLGRSFTSGKERSLFSIAKEIISSRPEGILIIANALDTALICQQVRKINRKIYLLTSEWAFTSDVLRQGGKSVEGVIFIEKIDFESHYPLYKEFSKEYEKRFGRFPDFAASKAYEAVLVLADALRKTTDRKKLKEAIIQKGDFQGLQGKLAIDRFGDARVDHFIVTVKNNRFKVLKKL